MKPKHLRPFKILGYVVSMLLLIYFVVFVSRTFSTENLRPFRSPTTLVYLGIASLVYCLIIPLAGWAWSLLLTSMGERWTNRRTIAIIGFTQIAKYIPGNIAQIAGRATLAISKGMNPGIFGATVLIETLLTMAAAVVTGLACWLIAGEHYDALNNSFWHAIATLTTGLLCGTLGMVVLLKLLPGLRSHALWAARWIPAEMQIPNIRVICKTSAIYCLSYIAVGLSFWIVAHSLNTEDTPSYFYLSATFALAWVIGFITPGLPAGLGAREGVMTALLMGKFAAPDILNLMLGMRLVTIVGDLLSFGMGAILMHLYFRKKTSG
ncbi:hypothetical protein FACS1894116_09100 [Betaproteobacteria bacterium]|nr:hypothetical protein FACS1894116_09100 [Betaproteobacteria bacterium]GHT99645.1 hypothetical protein FACS1894154_07130 [Betaproteobacteria bacterium]GHU24377.1 hypothetical protein FACS189488_08880 [Betaproteobacteria bacterium]